MNLTAHPPSLLHMVLRAGFLSYVSDAVCAKRNNLMTSFMRVLCLPPVSAILACDTCCVKVVMVAQNQQGMAPGDCEVPSKKLRLHAAQHAEPLQGGLGTTHVSNNSTSCRNCQAAGDSHVFKSRNDETPGGRLSTLACTLRSRFFHMGPNLFVTGLRTLRAQGPVASYHMLSSYTLTLLLTQS